MTKVNKIITNDLIVLRKKLINADKQLQFALTELYGIGTSKAKQILFNLGINPKISISKLREQTFSRLQDYIENPGFIIENSLKLAHDKNIKQSMFIRSYRGYRHRNVLPVHGQRTHTNGKTSKKRRVLYFGKLFNINKNNK